MFGYCYAQIHIYPLQKRYQLTSYIPIFKSQNIHCTTHTHYVFLGLALAPPQLPSRSKFSNSVNNAYALYNALCV